MTQQTTNTDNALMYEDLLALKSRAEVEGGLAGELLRHVHHLEKLLRNERRTRPYPDCKLTFSMGSDGWNIYWMNQSRSSHYQYRVSGITLSQSEVAWVAESAVRMCSGRSLLVERFKLSGIESILQEWGSIDALRDRMKFECEKIRAKLDAAFAELPEPSPVTSATEGPPLPAEFHDDCKWCDGPVTTRRGGECWACNGSGKVWVRPAPEKP